MTLNRPWRKRYMAETKELLGVDLVEIEELESKIAPDSDMLPGL